MAENRLNVGVDLNNVPFEKCKCGNTTWKVVFLLKRLSKLISPNGKETLVPIQVFCCEKCGTISPLYANLNATDEITDSEGESLEGGVKEDTEPPPSPPSTGRLYVG